ncbi:MAG: hypothetical protein OXF47_03580 [Nitrospira sp.]|nr:hypothetical protein [Nitrospira sp.]
MSVLEGQCELQSLRLLQDSGMGVIVNGLGVCLSLMYQQACCAWGCHGKEHVFEYASGRTVNHAMGSYRLALRGLYDESLSLTRNIAEIANLVALFCQEPNSVREWMDCSDDKRRKAFSPAKIRLRLTNGQNLLAVDEKQYRHLCKLAVHFGPNTHPGSHNESDGPVLGGIVQETGLRSSVTQLAWMVATVAGPIAKTAIVAEERAKELVEASIALLRSVSEQSEED